jgi:translation elongation factor EF-4
MSSSRHRLYHIKVITLSLTVTVLFKDGKETFISNPAEFPDVTDPKARVAGVEEPMGKLAFRCLVQYKLTSLVNATIFVPNGEPHKSRSTHS